MHVTVKRLEYWDFPEGPVAKTPWWQRRGLALGTVRELDPTRYN